MSARSDEGDIQSEYSEPVRHVVSSNTDWKFCRKVNMDPLSNAACLGNEAMDGALTSLPTRATCFVEIMLAEAAT